MCVFGYIADLSVRLFAHASLWCFNLVSSLRLVSPMYTLPQVHAWYLVYDVRLLLSGEGVFCLGEKTTEGGSGLEHRSDAEVLAHLSDPLANACYVWKKGYWRLLCRTLTLVVALDFPQYPPRNSILFLLLYNTLCPNTCLDIACYFRVWYRFS